MAEGGLGSLELESPKEDKVKQKEEDNEIKDLLEHGKKAVIIVVIGNSGAGKTSLINKVLGLKTESTGLNPKFDTTVVQIHKIERHGITLNIVDTEGLSQHRKTRKRQLKQIDISKVNLLLFCVTVGPSSRFQNDNPQIMESLRQAFGRNIWRHCLMVYTFSNLAWDCVKDEPAAVDLYKRHIVEYTNMFHEELIKLGCSPDLKVNTIFECPDIQQRPKCCHMIVAVPAGHRINDPVLPDIQLDEEGWVGRLFMEMVLSAEEDSKRALLQFRYTREYLKKAIRNPRVYKLGHVLQHLTSPTHMKTKENAGSEGDTDSEDDEESDRFVQDAMSRNETIKRKLAHGMFVGPTGAGKTSLMDRLLGKKRKNFSPSTGVAEPVVVVDVNPSTFHSVTVMESEGEGNSWQEVAYDESLVRQMTATSEPEPVAAVSLQPVIDTQDSPGETTHVVAPADLSSVSLPRDVMPIAAEPSKHISPAMSSINIIKMRVKKYGGYKKFKRFLKKTFSLYLRDAGGQVEFQEILPLLIFGPSIFFFVFRLDLDFKSKFTVEYRKSAGESLNCYTSSITTEEAFLQFLASVYAMDTNKASVKTHEPLVFVVGTHKDKLGELPSKRINDLNKYLSSLIKERGFENLIAYADSEKNEIMFTVDNTSSGDKDFEIIQSRVNDFVISREAFTIEYPLCYLLFSLELQDMKCSILTLDECKVMAAKYGIDENELLHLLQFLHLRIGVIRYFDKNGVNHIIIKEPQVLFNAVTDLVVKTFSCKALTAKEAHDFVKKGILTASVLKTTVKNLDMDHEIFLRLLTHLHIATLKGHERYFIPHVLNHISESSEDDPETDILPLIVNFKCEHCPKGLFSVLVTHLMNPDLQTVAGTTFTLIEDKIFRDQVSFEVHSPGVQDEMALKLYHSHLEIKFFPEHSEDRDTSIPEVCCNVHQILETSIQQSLQDLHYNMDRTAPEMCLRCGNCSELHVVRRGKKSFKMYCRKNRASKEIPPQGECWFKEEPAVQSPLQSLSLVPTGRLQDSDLPGLCDKLGPYPYKWKDIALGLGFTHHEIRTIEATPRLYNEAPLSYLREMLSNWLQWAPGDVRGSTDYATRDTLRRAVDRAGLGLTAQEL